MPEGTTTDFASVPRVAWSVISRNDYRTNPAAVLHDFLYKNGGKITLTHKADLSTREFIFPRNYVDHLFREMLDLTLEDEFSKKISPISKWKQYIMYRAVRLFGGPNFKKTEGPSNV